jgi:hypothetical protein
LIDLHDQPLATKEAKRKRKEQEKDLQKKMKIDNTVQDDCSKALVVDKANDANENSDIQMVSDECVKRCDDNHKDINHNENDEINLNDKQQVQHDSTPMSMSTQTPSYTIGLINTHAHYANNELFSLESSSRFNSNFANEQQQQQHTTPTKLPSYQSPQSYASPTQFKHEQFYQHQQHQQPDMANNMQQFQQYSQLMQQPLYSYQQQPQQQQQHQTRYLDNMKTDQSTISPMSPNSSVRRAQQSLMLSV